MHGYDLRKRIREEFGPLENLSFGSLYPALARLEESADIRALPVPEPVVDAPTPFTGSLGGERAATVAKRATRAAAVKLGGRGTRARKVYEITPAGEALFERLLDSTEGRDDPRSFLVRLAFARHLAPAARVRLLDHQRLELERKLARCDEGLATPARVIDRFQRAIAEHLRDGVRADLSWTSSLLELERAALASDPIPPSDGTITFEPATAGANAPAHGGTT